MGNLMPLLSVCDQLGWVDLSPALLGESFARQVLWGCRDVPELSRIPDSTEWNDTKQELLVKLFESTTMFRRFFSFNYCFLRLVDRHDLTATAAIYDRTLGLPSKHMISTLHKLLAACQEVTDWPEFFRSIGMDPPSPRKLYKMWADAVQVSLRCRYHNRRTDFSKIQCRGVSNVLLRGERYNRIAFCIDISDSMTQEYGGMSSLSRMEAVQQDIEDILRNRLTHRHQFALVAFNQTAAVWGLEGSHLQQATKRNVDAAINLVRSVAFAPSGGTNIMDALRSAFGIPNIQAVYLISAGEDNAVSLDEVEKLSLKGRIHCHTTVIGSSREGAQLLQSIAEVTKGTFSTFGHQTPCVKK